MLGKVICYKNNQDNKTAFIISVPDDSTFWQELCKQQKVSYARLSDVMRIDKSYLRKCFSGQIIPSTNLSVQLCDYFGVDYSIGAAEFNKAHIDWLAKNPGKFKKRSYVRSRKFDVSNIQQEDIHTLVSNVESPKDIPNVEPPRDTKALVKLKDTPEVRDHIAEILRAGEEEDPAKTYIAVKSQEASKSVLRRDELLTAIYGKVPKDMFIQFLHKPYTIRSRVVLELIYNVVDYSTYCEVYQILKKYSDQFPI